MNINNNSMGVSAYRQSAINNRAFVNSAQQIASGMRINGAADDVAGLAISETMRGQFRGLNQASRNAQDSISMVQLADGALEQSQSIVHRMRELAVQSANDTYSDDDRSAIQIEMDQLSQELTRIANDTEFNTKKLLNGNLEGKGGAEGNPANATGEIKFHIGANTDQNMTFGIDAMDAASLGLARDGVGVGEQSNPAKFVMENGVSVVAEAAKAFAGISVSTQSDANNAFESLDNALNAISETRSKMGAVQNRLTHTIKNLDVADENLRASESRIRDVDVAKAMMEMTKNSILQQTSQAMMVHQNHSRQNILQLLQ